jgi:hypothetical protein
MPAIECENGAWRESLPGLAFGHFVPGGAGQVSLNINTDRHAVRAMIEKLLRTLPAYRHAALYRELSMLDREIEKQFPYPEELALARIADPQGPGGRPRATAVSEV